MKKLVLLLACAFVSVNVYAMETQPIQAQSQEQKTTVLTVDHDDVINIKNKMNALDYARYAAIIARIAWNNPSGAASLVWNWRSIKNRGMETAQRVDGTSNIIYTLAQELKEEGYPDLTPYVEEMTAITVKPTPIWPTINYLKELKGQGYTIVGATNQDYFQNKYFRERMEAQGIKFNDFLDGVLVAHTVIKAQELETNKSKELLQLLDADKQIYMPTAPDGHKPNPHYYAALKALGTKLNSRANHFIHTDDLQKNIVGAQNYGFSGAHFNLPDGKSARRCTSLERQNTFDAWKVDLDSQLARHA